MNIIKRATIGLLAAVALSWAQTVWAADNGTEFGIADDLSVYGTTGSWADPDVEIKGFTVFGDNATGTNHIAAAPGNVGIRGNLQVDATSYFGSSVTIAGSAAIGSSLNVGGYGVFLSTVQIANGNLQYGTSATPGQVLKADANGFVTWGTDLSGASGGSPYYIPMWDNTGNAFVKSPLVGNSNTPTNLTMNGSSMTINGPFESSGTVKLGNSTAGAGDVTIVGAATVGGSLGVTGLATVGGTLGVTGAATLSDNLSVSSNTQLGNNIGNKTGINHAPEDGVALAVHGDVNSGNYVVKFYSGSDNTNLTAWIKKK